MGEIIAESTSSSSFRKAADNFTTLFFSREAQRSHLAHERNDHLAASECEGLVPLEGAVSTAHRQRDTSP